MIKFTSLASIAAISFLFFGCSSIPKPIELDSSSQITINQELIRQERHNIPLDPFLEQNNWTYNLMFEKSGDEYIPNNMIVKTFYVAHNADKIIVIGNKKIAQDYKDYLASNGCKNIAIHPVDSIGQSKKRVNILFFGMMGADVGYGLVLLLATMFVLKVVNLSSQMRKSVKFFFYLSFSVIFWGILYGSYFGAEIPGMWRLINPSKEYNTLLIGSIVFGVVHIFIGLAIKAYMLIRDGKALDAVYDVLF